MSEASILHLRGLAPIQREGAADQVARRILALVQSGSLRPGHQLPAERELALILGVSRPVVREALRGLSILGVVNVRPGGGAFISALDAADLLAPLQFFIALDRYTVDALYDARILIEGGIAQRAAVRIGDAQVATLRELARQQQDLLDDPVRYRVSDLDFHAVLIEAAGNPFLARVAQSLNVLGMEFRRVDAEHPAVLAQSVHDHEAIIAAMQHRDPVAAMAAMEQHMRNVWQTTEGASAGP
jgi:GntR family transcriptional repressor for pyruvate dehydrogenase complex